MKKVLSIILCVCLLATTVFTMPMVSAEEATEVEYFYHANDYESLTGEEEWLSTIEQGRAMSVESGANAISGGKSLKVTSNGVGWIGAALSDAKVPAGVTARVSFDYKVIVGKKGWGGVGYIGYSKKTNSAGVENVNCYNWASINNNDYTEAKLDIPELATLNVVKNFKGTLARKGTSAYPVGIYYGDGSATSEVLFDNLVIAEIIKTVSAVSADEAKGTVAVANKEAKYTDYAMGETAVFTATPAEGYQLAGWYNGEVLVSKEATYEHTLTGDTTLTAKWKLEEKEYQYVECDYENLTDTDAWFSKADGNTGVLTVSLEKESPISGSASLKLTKTTVGENTGYGGFAVFPDATTLKSGKYYRVKANTKIQSGTFNMGRFGNIGNKSGGTYNWAHIFNAAGYTGQKDNGGTPLDIWNAWDRKTAPASFTTHGMLKISENASLSRLGIAVNAVALDANNEATILIDNLVAAEMIDSVTATSEDATKGTVSVANKDGFEDYAVKEVAVFTATPKNGYYLDGWYNANGDKVSSDKVYEVTLTTDTNLTAKFAAYENLSTIFFNTNGGNDIDAITNGVGADFVLPETPVKAGFTFAGWYTNVDCTTPFTATTFPAEDITIHAKWIVGSYIDFENYQTTPSGNVTVMNDGENAYSGNGYLKYSATAKDGGSRIVLTDGKAIKDFALAGDKIEISFKYKLVSGNAKFYIHTSSKTDRVALINRKTAEETKDLWINAYKHKNTNITTVSEDWQTLTAVYDLKNLAEATADRITFEDYLYSALLFDTNNETGVELYIDDVTLALVPGEHVKTAYNNAAALRSAAASSTGKNGLRIYNQVDTQWVENKNIVEYGSIAAFAFNIDGEINLENGIKGISYSDGTFSPEKSTIWDVQEGAVIYTSYITNIPASRYSEDILIRSYAIAEDGTVYYGKTVNVSVFEVANAIDNANTADGSEQTEADAAAFYLFVTEGNANAYAAWCAENGKTVGTLYNNEYAA